MDDFKKENYWRSLILYGANVATYKFALGKTLLDLADKGKSSSTLEELSTPFALNLCDHLKSGKKQCTNEKSAFIDACRSYNDNIITMDQLIGETKRSGFKYVLDAFHVLPRKGSVSERFYEIAGSGMKRNLIFTDNFLSLKDSIQFQNLIHEVEARWCLVEDAWTFETGKYHSQVQFDLDTSKLYVEERTTYRRSLTHARDAFIGYQKGKCFYCLNDIILNGELTCHVDHFIPFALRYKLAGHPVDLNGVWNLVLACPKCNSGQNGKFDKVPTLKLLKRLNKRNNYLIASKHPLSETISHQTGSDDQSRENFLLKIHQFSFENIREYWEPQYEFSFDF